VNLSLAQRAADKYFPQRSAARPVRVKFAFNETNATDGLSAVLEKSGTLQARLLASALKLAL
jgi:hypothetical protein